jgi:hypothetical protein
VSDGLMPTGAPPRWMLRKADGPSDTGFVSDGPSNAAERRLGGATEAGGPSDTPWAHDARR